MLALELLASDAGQVFTRRGPRSFGELRPPTQVGRHLAGYLGLPERGLLDGGLALPEGERAPAEAQGVDRGIRTGGRSLLAGCCDEACGPPDGPHESQARRRSGESAGADEGQGDGGRGRVECRPASGRGRGGRGQHDSRGFVGPAHPQKHPAEPAEPAEYDSSARKTEPNSSGACTYACPRVRLVQRRSGRVGRRVRAPPALFDTDHSGGTPAAQEEAADA